MLALAGLKFKTLKPPPKQNMTFCQSSLQWSIALPLNAFHYFFIEAFYVNKTFSKQDITSWDHNCFENFLFYFAPPSCGMCHFSHSGMGLCTGVAGEKNIKLIPPAPLFTEMAYYQMWFMLVVRLELPFEKTARVLLCSSFGRQADGFKRTCLRGMECARLMSYLLGPALVLLELC